MLAIDHAALVAFLDELYTLDPTERIRAAVRELSAMTGARSGVGGRYATRRDGDRFVIDCVAGFLTFGPDAGPWTQDTWDFVVSAPGAANAFSKTGGFSAARASGVGAALADLPDWHYCWKAPIRDAIALVAHDTNGRGLVVGVGVREVVALDVHQQRLLTRLAIHMGAADRLPAKRSVDAADAVLSPSGKLLHAAEPARIPEVLKGVERRAFARKSRHDAEQALDAWQGLVDGTWSIVDHFDTDGKRFVLAMKNAPEVAPRAELAPQDRSVAALAAMGHRDKEIAYSLGITMGRVAAALRRTRAALRVKTRAELAAAWRRSAE